MLILCYLLFLRLVLRNVTRPANADQFNDIMKGVVSKYVLASPHMRVKKASLAELIHPHLNSRLTITNKAQFITLFARRADKAQYSKFCRKVNFMTKKGTNWFIQKIGKDQKLSEYQDPFLLTDNPLIKAMCSANEFKENITCMSKNVIYLGLYVFPFDEKQQYHKLFPTYKCKNKRYCYAGYVGQTTTTVRFRWKSALKFFGLGHLEHCFLFSKGVKSSQSHLLSHSLATLCIKKGMLFIIPIKSARGKDELDEYEKDLIKTYELFTSFAGVNAHEGGELLKNYNNTSPVVKDSEKQDGKAQVTTRPKEQVTSGSPKKVK